MPLKLFHVRQEGAPIKQGVSVWPKGDPASAGFIVRIWFAMLWVRWSKLRQLLTVRLSLG